MTLSGFHTPKAVTYHEPTVIWLFMIGHSFGRMETWIAPITWRCWDPIAKHVSNPDFGLAPLWFLMCAFYEPVHVVLLRVRAVDELPDGPVVTRSPVHRRRLLQQRVDGTRGRAKGQPQVLVLERQLGQVPLLYEVRVGGQNLCKRGHCCQLGECAVDLGGLRTRFFVFFACYFSLFRLLFRSLFRVTSTVLTTFPIFYGTFMEERACNLKLPHNNRECG